MLSLGQVTVVRVPTEDQEALRDLSRARQQASKELAHAKQRVNALMLRRGLYYPEKSRWTGAHLEWLHRQHFAQKAAQLTLEADLELVVMLKEHLKRLETQITEQIQDCEYQEVIDALMCFRGISTTTAYGLAVEIGDWTGSPVRPSAPTSGWSRPNIPPGTHGPRVRSPRPGIPMPGACWWRPRGSTTGNIRVPGRAC